MHLSLTWRGAAIVSSIVFAILPSGMAGSASIAGQTPSSPNAAPQSTGAISGIVIDATTERPVPGAVVYLSIDNRRALLQSRQVTDRQGRFVFVDIAASDRLAIVAGRAGYLESSMGQATPGAGEIPLTLLEGQALTDVRVRLWKAAAIGGTVRDEQGEPVAGVLVRAYARLRFSGRDQLAASAVSLTDDRGEYRLPNLLPGRYVVAVPSVPAAIPSTLSDERVFGVTPSGALAGPRVAAFEIDSTFRLVPGPYATPPPSEAGRPAAYPTTFHPSTSTVAEALSVETTYGQERTGVDITLAPVRTSSVSGRVEGSAEDRASLTLRLIAKGMEGLGTSSEAGTALVAADGSFRFVHVAPGQYTIESGRGFGEYQLGRIEPGVMQRLRTPGSPGFGTNTRGVDGMPGVSYSSTSMSAGPGSRPVLAHLSLTVANMDLTDVVVPLRAPVSVSGLVRIEADPKKPAISPRVPLSVEPADGAAGSGTRPLMDPNDQTGAFTLDGLAPGSYVFRSELPTLAIKSVIYGGRDYTDTPLDLSSVSSADGVTVTVTNQTATVTGTVVDGTGRPVADALVAIFPADRSQWANFGRSSPRIRSAPVSATGVYRLLNLPAGDYFVAVVPADRTTTWRNADVFTTLAGAAARVRVDWGDVQTQGLRTNDR